MMKALRRTIPCVLILVLALISAAKGQQTDDFSLLPDLAGLRGDAGGQAEIEVSASFQTTRDNARGQLMIRATLSPGWSIYSVTQQPGGPMRTQVKLQPTRDFELIGPFRPDVPATAKETEFFDVPVEEHEGEVTWTAPVRFAAGINPQQLEIRGRLDGQVCNEQGGCIPLSVLDTDFVAVFDGSIEPADLPAVSQEDQDRFDKRRTPPVDGPSTSKTAPGTSAAFSPFAQMQFADPGADGFRSGPIHAGVEGYVEPLAVEPGGVFRLHLTIRPDPGWHVYAYQATDPQGISKPTLIAMVEPSGWQAESPTTNDPVIVEETGISLEPETRYHEGTATWTIPIRVPSDQSVGEFRLAGFVGYQTCTDARCDMPTAAAFAAQVQIGESRSGQAALQFAAAQYATVAKYADGTLTTQPPASLPAPSSASSGVGFDLSKIEVVEPAGQSVAYILLLAFLGGFVLNFMPCVLPVIGLKIMAFVHQAGQNRRQVFMLNVWYSLGMLSIFWLLATLASAASLGLSDQSLGWGEQFSYDAFTIPLLCVVFAMGLSFLGVWEIPLPGFVGSSKASELAQKEGVSGAFVKGVITTILATPCSGPGLATALTWSATKPPVVVYLVFTFMGLGMAFPYLIIGAFPRLVRFIPKPGPWMDTFKNLMGFVLLGTVVYLFTLVNGDNVIPTLGLIFAIWAACWWIGRTPITASLFTKLRAWTAGSAFAALVGWLLFTVDPESQHELPWREYSLASLDEHIRANRTVLVDFTADW